MNHIIKSPTITIEKNIPIPSPAGRGRAKRFPFDEMEVGDSFFASGVSRTTMSSKFAEYHKHTSKRFTARSQEGGARYWRIA